MAAIPDFSLDLAEFFVDFPTEKQAQPQKARSSVVSEEALEELREKNHNKNAIKSTRTWLKVFHVWREERYIIDKRQDSMLAQLRKTLK